jgi:hypothetical protein
VGSGGAGGGCSELVVMLASASDIALVLALISLGITVLFVSMILATVGLIVFLVRDYVKDRRMRAHRR